MEEYKKPLTRIARFRHFFQDRHIRLFAIFNIFFIYVWGYLLWGTTEVGSGEWLLEECGHLLWSGFHTWVLISYQKYHYPEEFEYWREKEERLIWFRVILFSVFFWEGFELLHDSSGLFQTLAQLSNRDTMADIIFSGLAGPLFSISYWRWKDGLNLFFAPADKKQATERKLRQVRVLLSQIAEETNKNEPQVLDNLRFLVRRTWQENHHILPVVKMLYGVARGSRRERRRRRAYIRSLRFQKTD